jgi:hypothetical protein
MKNSRKVGGAHGHRVDGVDGVEGVIDRARVRGFGIEHSFLWIH